MTVLPERPTPAWALNVLRGFGALDLLFVAFGLYLIASGLTAPGGFTRAPDPELPFLTEAYVLRTIINLVFLAVETVAGVLLLRGQLLGVSLSNVLFAAMMADFLIPVWDLFGRGFASSIAAVGGTGNMGTAPQIITAYPLIALIGLNLARRKLKKATTPPKEGAEGRWPAKSFKVFGVLHVAFFVLGLYVVVGMAGYYISSDGIVVIPPRSEIPYGREVFLSLLAANLVLLTAEGIAGVLLLRMRMGGVTISNILFPTMIGYFFLPLLFYGTAIGRSVVAVMTIGNVGIGFQLITAYPIAALVVLNLARQRLRRADPRPVHSG